MTEKRTRKTATSIIHQIEVDESQIPTYERNLLRDLPDEKKLRTPYWKNKMKAFQGKEELSWEIQDKYQSSGISIVDLIGAIKKCPLDGDLWGFFGVFDLNSNARLELYKRGAIAGEIYLGRTMQDEVGNFWGILDTRPYMRCLNMMYRELVKMKRPKDAALIGRRMLELCKNDNIGIRFSIDRVEEAVDDNYIAEEMSEAFAVEDAADLH